MGKKLIATLLCLLLFLVSCNNEPYSYSGEHPELYSVAINSLLWNKGAASSADRLIDPTISIIERDAQGRVLFTYTETPFGSDVSFSSLIIMQYHSDKYVYYYDDVNFISKELSPYSDISATFDSRDVEILKASNDWNCKLNLDKCIKKEITTIKREVTVDEDALNEIFSEYDGYYSNSTFLLTDDGYGRFICYSRIAILEGGDCRNQYIVILFQNDLTYSILAPNSVYDYQDELKKFKEINCWNQPIS